MGLQKIIQIPCHHILSNQNTLKLEKGAPLKQFFNINLGIGIIKKLLFLFVFSTYILVFLLKFWSGELVGCVIWFRIQRVTTPHTFDGPRYPKTRNTWKTWWWHHHHIFLGISCFWGRGVHQKYVVWVIVGCGIKFRIQRALLIKIWVKTQRDMLKIRTKK